MDEIIFLINKALSDEVIIKTLADLFSISQDEILIIDDLGDLPEKLKEQKVYILKTKTKGEFTLYLSVTFVDKKLAQFDSDNIISQFAIRNECECITGTDPDPYMMRLFTQHGFINTIYLDVDCLNDNDEYIVTKTFRYFKIANSKNELDQLVRIVTDQQGLTGEYFDEDTGEWIEHTPLTDVLIVPAYGEQITDKEAIKIAQEYGWEMMSGKKYIR